MISLDTETTGVDFWHGARPYFVTSCDEDGNVTSWEWEVDPRTREPIIPDGDKSAIGDLIFGADGYGEHELILQNAKFDVHALQTILSPFEWPWHRTHDTLFAGHVLASNRPHNLTDMILEYVSPRLAKHMEELEEATHKVTEECRRYCRSHLKDWRIAKKDDPSMPSAKEKTWKYDMWLPRALAKELAEPQDHIWQTVLRSYAEADSQSTIMLWKVMREELQKRDLWDIYLMRKSVAPIAYDMERRGITVSARKLDELTQSYSQESKKLGDRCVGIAASLGCSLELPKAGNNQSLSRFAFGDERWQCIRCNHIQEANGYCEKCGDGECCRAVRVGGLGLPPLKTSDKTGVPSLDKNVLEEYEIHYESLLPVGNGKIRPTSKQLSFVKALKNKRKRDTALQYLEGYTRFWLPWSSQDGTNREGPSPLPQQVHKGEAGRVLAMDSGQAADGVRLLLAERQDGSSPQDLLCHPQGSNSKGTPHSPQLRQSALRKSKPPVPRNPARQYARYVAKGTSLLHNETGADSERRSERGTNLPGVAQERGGEREFQTSAGDRPSDSSGIQSSQEQGVSSEDVQRRSSNGSNDHGGENLEASNRNWYVLHPNLNPTGTDTLRWSSNNPNEQNISKQEGFNLRYCFGPAPGREWWSMDAKNIELRIPAYEANESDVVYIFEHPKDPPYYGSYHLFVFDLLHPELFKKHGAACKELFESTWYQWVKNGNFCVPMDTQALTSVGWKTYDQLEVGDLVLGYDNGKLRWTPVLEKYQYESAPLVRMENEHFSSVSTPNHRWLASRRTGSLRTRRQVQEFVTTERVNTEHSLILSAPTEDNCVLEITPTEAAIIGFVYGDGGIEYSEYVGASSQSGGRKVKFRVKIFQSKPKGVEYIDTLLQKWGKPFKRRVRSSGIVEWDLNPTATRDLWERAQLPVQGKTGDMEEFVIRLGNEHREAYLEAVHQAEGWTDRQGTKLYAQNCGSFANSIRLAVFLSGKFPTTIYPKTSYPTNKQMSAIRESKPSVTGQKLVKTRIADAPVWCIKTELSTWVMRQGDQIMLTGNSVIYGAQEEKADATYKVPGAFRKIRHRLPRIAALSDKWKTYADKHGYVETIPDKSVNPRRGYPLLCTRTEYGRVMPTIPLNYHVSGTAMQWMHKAMIRCHAQLQEWNRRDPDYHLIMQVHDELVFDFPKEAHPKEDPKNSNLWRARKLQQLMEAGGVDINVPTPTSCEYHEHDWSTGTAL